MSHLLASPVSPLNSLGRVWFPCHHLFHQWEDLYGWETRRNQGGKSLGNWEGIWIRSSDGVVDCEWKPLEKVGGGQKEEWDDRHVGLYDDPVPVTLHSGGAGSTMGGGAEKDWIASSLSQASWATRSVVRFILFVTMMGYYHLVILWEFRHSSTKQK